MAKGLFKKSKYINILVAITAFLISLIFVEVILRVFFIKDIEPVHYLFITKPALQDQEKIFGFKENADIREVAVHWNGKEFEIIYDTSFSTNNIGLVQKNSFDPKKEAIVLVGDSFTQGEGALPWFYKLEENWQNSRYQLINLGIMGTGIEQWKYILSWFSELGNIKHIFICFITDDWNRRRCVIRDNLD